MTKVKVTPLDCMIIVHNGFSVGMSLEEIIRDQSRWYDFSDIDKAAWDIITQVVKG